MSYLDKNLPDPLDRLGVLLEHAQGLAVAATSDDFATINDKDQRSFFHALMHVVIDANEAFNEMVKTRKVAP